MNTDLFSLFYNLRQLHPIVSQLAIFFGFYLPYLLVAGLPGYLFFSSEYYTKKRFFITLAAFISSALAYLVTLLIREQYPVKRPFAAFENIQPLIDASAKALASFPSGHATIFFALGTFLYFYHTRLGAIYLIGATLIGLGRVVAGVHWPLDVIAGAAIGIASAFCIRWLTRGIKKNL